ncbi:ATP-binding protein [Alicyclobacillus dauci]|uniref:histidine kinase n=1 Tax=Alicyclobacillus dauci TaxID=1475485 RepID=A0ABY6Z8M8_9BACL|nr:ATP-binding protein [Alicyclobacillus dauci]WAH39159.1 ATP-binding protein [Alicyclobacillus dauci]
MKQVFINVVKNAIEAMPNGGRLSINLATNNDTVSIQFIDEGIGIPADVVPRIGEPFYTTKQSGTGLGVMVSQKIIIAHHGTIDISSEVGKGTTVNICLPITPLI